MSNVKWPRQKLRILAVGRRSWPQHCSDVIKACSRALRIPSTARLRPTDQSEATHLPQVIRDVARRSATPAAQCNWCHLLQRRTNVLTHHIDFSTWDDDANMSGHARPSLPDSENDMHNSPRSHHTPPPCLPGNANVLGRSVTAAVAVAVSHIDFFSRRREHVRTCPGDGLRHNAENAEISRR